MCCSQFRLVCKSKFHVSLSSSRFTDNTLIVQSQPWCIYTRNVDKYYQQDLFFPFLNFSVELVFCCCYFSIIISFYQHATMHMTSTLLLARAQSCGLTLVANECEKQMSVSTCSVWRMALVNTWPAFAIVPKLLGHLCWSEGAMYSLWYVSLW